MKLRWIAALAALIVAGCGPNPQGNVIFTGSTPRTALEKDNRGAYSKCSLCGKDIEFGKTLCPNQTCRAKLAWAKEYACPFCNATGTCKACEQMGNVNGNCYKCNGTGYIVFQGKTPPCAACDKGKCKICKGTGKCDYCKGEKKLSQDQVKALMSKKEEPEPEPDTKRDDKKEEKK